MGLLYQFPAEENPLDDCVKITQGKLTLVNYGLPYLFWFYFAAFLVLLLPMYLAVATPAQKLMQTRQLFDQLLGGSVFALLLALPVIALSFFTYQKTICKKDATLLMIHKLFGITYWKQSLALAHREALTIVHCLDSPNVAAQKQMPGTQGFQNRGYYQLLAEGEDGKQSLVDRHSQLGEIKKIQRLLLKY